MKPVVAVLSSALLTACAYSVPSYEVANAVPAELAGQAGIKVVNAGSKFDDTGSILCRAAGNVQLPGGQTFAKYLEDALKKEAIAAGLLDEVNGLQMRMTLERVDFSTTLGATNWFIDARYVVAGSEFLIATVYNDRSSYLGDKACANMARYFQKAVALHLRQLFSEPLLKRKLHRM